MLLVQGSTRDISTVTRTLERTSTGAQLSDYARSKNVSGILSKSIKYTEQNSGKHLNSTCVGASSNINILALVTIVGNEEEYKLMPNITELHKLVLENPGRRQEFNLGKELLRLTTSSNDANGTSIAKGNS